jgi:CRISPR/Cas system endoribonuclease Cas6 (RAMP superfamily)
MDRQTLEKIKNNIYKKFPEVSGSNPTKKPYGDDKILLVFKGKVSTANGKTMDRVVRVVVDANGKIIKTTTSR